MAGYLNSAVRLYLQELIDWDSYFNWCKGEAADVEADSNALWEVLETAAQICVGIEADARAGWAEEAKLENGKVVYPPHIAKACEKLSEAGLLSFGVEEKVRRLRAFRPSWQMSFFKWWHALTQA